MRCPRDRAPLAPLRLDHAVCYLCGSCAGHAVTAPLLRRMMDTDRYRDLWTRVRAAGRGGHACPSCAGTMRHFAIGGVRAPHEPPPLPGASADLPLDACPKCLIVWFDADELRAVAPDAARPGPIVDGTVPGDRSDEWVWKRFFGVLNEKHYGGLAGDVGTL